MRSTVYNARYLCMITITCHMCDKIGTQKKYDFTMPWVVVYYACAWHGTLIYLKLFVVAHILW